MRLRVIFFSAVFLGILYLFTEILLRLVLVFYGYPFLHPSDYIYKGFYKELEPVSQKEVRRGDDVKDILILGGSVVSTPWSHMESRLDTLLRKQYTHGEKFAFYNTAAAGHTSLDNLQKYKLLKKQRFDLVIYYEAINENRANNVPPASFFADYSHMKWYRDIYLLLDHPEMNITVIPFLVDKVIKGVKDQVTHKIYVSQEQVDPKYVQYGGDIKTGPSFEKNILELIETAKERGDKLLLMSYATYFPENVKLTGAQADMDHFAGCNYASPVTIWGSAEHVKKGVNVHNDILLKLVRSHPVAFMDMAAQMPKDSSLFCDVCHVSEPGAQYFSKQLAQYIVDKKLLDQ